MYPPVSIEFRVSICVLFATSLLLASCSTSKERLLPHGDQTMLDVWNLGASGSADGLRNRTLLDARQALRRPLLEEPAALTNDQPAYSRQARNEIRSQFKRLPNPDLVMYVFPHLVGEADTPVPGYSTVFPLYERVQYAMPGERTEDY